jgi:hypothetical protein
MENSHRYKASQYPKINQLWETPQLGSPFYRMNGSKSNAGKKREDSEQ